MPTNPEDQNPNQDDKVVQFPVQARAAEEDDEDIFDGAEDYDYDGDYDDEPTPEGVIASAASEIASNVGAALGDRPEDEGELAMRRFNERSEEAIQNGDPTLEMPRMIGPENLPQVDFLQAGAAPADGEDDEYGDDEGYEPPPAIGFQPLFQAYGYRMSAPLRTLGRSIFNAMPCYGSMLNRMKEVDALGQVEVLRYFNQGHGNNSKDQVDSMVEWVRENGSVLDQGNLDFGAIKPGYMPHVTFAVSDEHSFLMVEDSPENGAVFNGIRLEGVTIYCWPGGRQFYAANPLQVDVIRNMGKIDGRRIFDRPVPNALPVDAVRESNVGDAPPALDTKPEVVPPAPVVPAPEVAKPKAEVAPQAEAPATIPASVPAPAAPKRSVLATLRDPDFGFDMVASSAGPVLSRELPDGRTLVVSHADGKGLPTAKTFNLKVKNGETVEEEFTGVTPDALFDTVGTLLTSRKPSF